MTLYLLLKLNMIFYNIKMKVEKNLFSNYFKTKLTLLSK